VGTARGSILAGFLGAEASFAVKCATDKDAWSFKEQRRYALTHMCFVSFVAACILSLLDTSTPHGAQNRQNCRNRQAPDEDERPHGRGQPQGGLAVGLGLGQEQLGMAEQG
ncbi:unnamed protein product, partial [Discosporangium mesarthrocarpum]